MGVERLAATEAARLLMHEPKKYVGLVVGLYLLSLKDYEVGKVTRANYLFLRHIDDFLDESQERTDSKLQYVLNLRDQVETRNFNGNPKIAELAKYSIEVLERKARPSDNPRRDFLNVIDAMIFDYKRAGERLVLSEEELGNYYRGTFFPVVNLTLIGLGSQFRASDVPTLSYGQGKVFSVRDLKEDWQRGVINIPKEILQQAQLDQNSPISQITKNATTKAWLYNELVESRKELIGVKDQLKASGERITPMLCNGVLKTASKLIGRYNSA